MLSISQEERKAGREWLFHTTFLLFHICFWLSASGDVFFAPCSHLRDKVHRRKLWSYRVIELKLSGFLNLVKYTS